MPGLCVLSQWLPDFLEHQDLVQSDPFSKTRKAKIHVLPKRLSHFKTSVNCNQPKSIWQHQGYEATQMEHYVFAQPVECEPHRSQNEGWSLRVPSRGLWEDQATKKIPNDELQSSWEEPFGASVLWPKKVPNHRTFGSSVQWPQRLTRSFCEHDH